MSLSSIRSSTVASAVAGAGVLLTIAAATLFGYELALLVLSSSVLLLVIVLFWASVRNLAGETPLSLDEAISMGAPSAAEEQKRAVLRALKDLEFERSVGKISEQDYLEFSARYRAEARKLIEAADESTAPAHDLAEKLVAERLVKAGLAEASKEERPAPAQVAAKEALSAVDGDDAEPPSAEAETDTEADPDGAAASANGSAAAGESSSRACAKCDTKNDRDARFCKGCGAPLGAAAMSEAAAPSETSEEKLS